MRFMLQFEAPAVAAVCVLECMKTCQLCWECFACKVLKQRVNKMATRNTVTSGGCCALERFHISQVQPLSFKSGRNAVSIHSSSSASLKRIFLTMLGNSISYHKENTNFILLAAPFVYLCRVQQKSSPSCGCHSRWVSKRGCFPKNTSPLITNFFLLLQIWSSLSLMHHF